MCRFAAVGAVTGLVLVLKVRMRSSGEQPLMAWSGFRFCFWGFLLVAECRVVWAGGCARVVGGVGAVGERRAAG